MRNSGKNIYWKCFSPPNHRVVRSTDPGSHQQLHFVQNFHWGWLSTSTVGVPGFAFTETFTLTRKLNPSERFRHLRDWTHPTGIAQYRRAIPDYLSDLINDLNTLNSLWSLTSSVHFFLFFTSTSASMAKGKKCTSTILLKSSPPPPLFVLRSVCDRTVMKGNIMLSPFSLNRLDVRTLWRRWRLSKGTLFLIIWGLFLFRYRSIDL